VCQQSGIINMPPFDHRAFCKMARQYSIKSGDATWESCNHNARVAAETGHQRTAQTWRILQLLFATLPEPRKEPRPILSLLLRESERRSVRDRLSKKVGIENLFIEYIFRRQHLNQLRICTGPMSHMVNNLSAMQPYQSYNGTSMRCC
jgi:Trp operon repressor